MYKIVFVSCLWFFTGLMPASAQKASGIVPFKILLQDGSVYTAKDLNPHMPVVLVYFAPDCDHCIAFTKQLLAEPSALENRQVLMITYFPLADLINFDKRYGVSLHSNIRIGTEKQSFIVRNYYGIQRFPFIVMYNSNGKEVNRHASEVPFNLVLDEIKKLGR